MHRELRERMPTVALLALVCAGCGELGKVNQGRVVAYDPVNGVVTLVADSNAAYPGEPRYESLPPLIVKVPAQSSDMGPAPEPGLLLDVDTQRNELRVFDSDSKAVRTIGFRVVDRRTKVSSRDPRVAGGRFPVVDRSGKSITIYRRKQRELLTFSVSDSDLKLPEAAWRLGDEVRYYYRDPGQALRMMNVTRTDIF